MRLPLLGLLMLVGTISCLSKPIEALPLTVTVEASRTTLAPKDSVLIVIRAEGEALIGLQAEYGDGTSVDAFATNGARTASVTFRHTYITVGTYTVTATAFDAAAGQKTATLQVRVN